jgi:hypothetical protein
LIPSLKLWTQYELNLWLIDFPPGTALAAMVRNSSLMICLSCQMLGQEVPEPDEPITNQALLMGLAGTFLQPLAPLLASPYITEACLVPFLESLCHLSSVCGHFKIKTPSDKKRRLMLFLDMMWAFLEVRYSSSSFRQGPGHMPQMHLSLVGLLCYSSVFLDVPTFTASPSPRPCYPRDP